SVRLDSLAFRSGSSRFRVATEITGALAPVPTLRRLEVDGGLDLGSLSALARGLGLLEEDIRLSGTQTVRLKASGPLDAARPQRITASGALELKDFKARLPGWPVV